MHPSENAKLWDFERKILSDIRTNNIDDSFHLYTKRQKNLGLHLIEGFDYTIGQFLRNEISVIGFYKNMEYYFGKDSEASDTFKANRHLIEDLRIQYWYFAAYPDAIMWFKKQEVNKSDIYEKIIDYLKNNQSYFPDNPFHFNDFAIDIIVNEYLNETDNKFELSSWNFDLQDVKRIVPSINTEQKLKEVNLIKKQKLSLFNSIPNYQFLLFGIALLIWQIFALTIQFEADEETFRNVQNFDILLKIGLAIWLGKTAGKQGRNYIAWGVFAFFLPSIAYIIFGFTKSKN